MSFAKVLDKKNDNNKTKEITAELNISDYNNKVMNIRPPILFSATKDTIYVIEEEIYSR